LVVAHRDYLSTFLKIGVIAGLAVGIIFAMPELKMPAITHFIDGTGPVFAGSLFPFLFITIACGAISGFHALVSREHTRNSLKMKEYSYDRLWRHADGIICWDHGHDLCNSA
jgi:carbon starvation protein CstA